MLEQVYEINVFFISLSFKVFIYLLYFFNDWWINMKTNNNNNKIHISLVTKLCRSYQYIIWFKNKNKNIPSSCSQKRDRRQKAEHKLTFLVQQTAILHHTGHQEKWDMVRWTICPLWYKYYYGLLFSLCATQNYN